MGYEPNPVWKMSDQDKKDRMKQMIENFHKGVEGQYRSPGIHYDTNFKKVKKKTKKKSKPA